MRTRVRLIRLKNKIHVNEVAENLGISASFYYKIEQGTRTPTLKLAKKISKFYGVRVEELF
ncbi:MAG: helix-turn-helix transcriptional regulator [Peptostreptococcaceae bacterium]